MNTGRHLGTDLVSMRDLAIMRKPRSEFRQELRLTTRAHPLAEEFGHPCGPVNISGTATNHPKDVD
jgi:hypothetical protein